MKKVVYLFLLCGTMSCAFQGQPTDPIQNEMEMSSFLSGHDLLYDSLSTHWLEGAFIGNGLLGAMLYREHENALRMDVSRTDVVDHREQYPTQYGKYRLPIGRFIFKTSGKIEKVDLRLDLWNAEIRGNIYTDSGSIAIQIFAHTEQEVFVIKEKPAGGEKLSINFLPELAVSPRYHYQNQWQGFAPEGFTPNPAPRVYQEGDIHYVVQELLAGGNYTTAWRQASVNEERVHLFTIQNSFPAYHSPLQAKDLLEKIGLMNYDSMVSTHRDWWHSFYQKSFISIPDKRMEGFWWIQQYKLASATRHNKPAIDVLGPWYKRTPWAAYWWNLNVQLTYYPMYSSNHLDLGESLINSINQNIHHLVANTPVQFRHNSATLGRTTSLDMKAVIDLDNPSTFPRGEPDMEAGNLTWILHNYYMHYQYSMDDGMLINLYPLLKRSINFYLNILQEGQDGELHLPVTYSPEYPGGYTRDCNYDLALLHWGCQTLLDLNSEKNYHDSLAVTWRRVLENLTEYPTNENGLMIGRDVPYDKSHRHYSHLLMIYPLHLLNGETQEEKELILKSLNHWHSFPDALQGYSFTGGASIYAKLGMGNEAYAYLDTLLNNFVKPNTMYMEAGPVIETPLSAVTSINEMLLQSWGGKIRIFPAVPDKWQNVAFHNLRTEGAFLVSAERKDGNTEWIRIKSLAGEPCIIKSDIDLDKAYISGINRSKISQKEDLLMFKLKPGEEVILSNSKSTMEINPVKYRINADFNYGLN